MLMKNPNLENLKNVHEGIDILIAQKVLSRRCKLRVLNLRCAPHVMGRIWAGSHEGEGLPQFITQKNSVEVCPGSKVEKELKVITDLKLVEGRLDESSTYLLHWAQQREDSIHLCCRKLQIRDFHTATFTEIFKIIHAGCIQELELSYLCIKQLAFLNPYLEQMKNLVTFMLDDIPDTSSMDDFEKLVEKMNSLISQLPTFHCLQNLYIKDVFFMEDNLTDCLRCLKTPLEKLSITYCDFLQSDLDYLPYCLNICELKHLNLSGTYFCNLHLEPLGILLERVKDTLQTLELESCRMEDTQVSALLPTLSQCSHLRKVNFYENNFSLTVLKQLLHHTAKLSQLTQEHYPVPLECYDDMGEILTYRLENFCPELLDILRAKRQPKRVTVAATQCCKDCGFLVYDLETQYCHFQRPVA